MDSIYLINEQKEIVLEKLYSKKFNVQTIYRFLKRGKLIDQIDEYVLIKFTFKNLSIVGVCKQEISPLGLIHQLIWFVELIQEYLGGFDETLITQNYDIVYQLLEDCFDDGLPYINETALLKQLVPPPSILNTVINSISISNTPNLPPTGMASRIPWRSEGISYAHNEIFFDTIEELDMIVDQKGMLVSSSVFGKIECLSRLSGMPELILSFGNKHVLEPGSVAFHHCIKQDRWEKDGVLVFIPPDGAFHLLEYNMEILLNQAPVLIKPVLKKTPSGASKLDIKVIPRLGNEKNLTWNIGAVAIKSLPKQPFASLTLSDDISKHTNLDFVVSFRVNMHSLSGLRIDGLAVQNEGFKPFKGGRSYVQSGRVHFRM